MKVGILATGITPDELLDQYGSYADMFVQLFNQAGRHFDYDVYDVRDGVFPTNAQVCDAWVITGSKSNVDEETDWMQRLKALILEIDQAGRPLVGICFGHQIIAEAFGGKVEAFSGGWGVGLHSYSMINGTDFSGTVPESVAMSAMHRYQVTEKPANARVFAESPFCKYAGLMYGKKIMTWQAHPEFNLAYEDDLIELRGGTAIPADIAEEGLKSIRVADAATDSIQIANWMADVLERR